MSDHIIGEAAVTVHSLERDLLEQWRAAVVDGDHARIGELVHLAHSLRDVTKTSTIGGGEDMLHL